MQISTVLACLDTRRMPADARVLSCLDSLARLAAAHDARLVLCDVIEQPPAAPHNAATSARLAEFRRRYALDTLERLGAGLRQHVVTDHLVLQGNPFVAITRHVMRHGIELVACIDASDAGGQPTPTASHLVRKCPAAVWLMGARGTGARQHFVVAVDRDIFPASDTPRTMAGQLVDAAVALARGENATVHLVHAWQVYGAELLDDPRLGLASDELASYVDSQRYSHRLWLDELHERLCERIAERADTAIETATHLLAGPAADVIPAWLAHTQVDALLIGTLGSSSTPGLLIGNTAEAIVSRAGVPLVALKPGGFRSPLEANPR